LEFCLKEQKDEEESIRRESLYRAPGLRHPEEVQSQSRREIEGLRLAMGPNPGRASSISNRTEGCLGLSNQEHRARLGAFLGTPGAMGVHIAVAQEEIGSVWRRCQLLLSPRRSEHAPVVMGPHLPTNLPSDCALRQQRMRSCPRVGSAILLARFPCRNGGQIAERADSVRSEKMNPRRR
jgi:hypothetical protein